MMKPHRPPQTGKKAVAYGGLEIKLPENWVDRSVFVFAQEKDEPTFETNFSVARIPEDKPMPLRNVVKNHPVSEGLDCLLVLSRDYRQEGGRDVFERIYRFVEPQEGTIVQQAQRFIQHDQDLIIMTLTAEASQFDAAYAVFDGAAKKMASAEAN